MNKLNTKITVNGFDFKNPVIPASGTFGFGREMAELYDLALLGGISSTGVTLYERKGNPPPRIAETPSGMLNSVGLQNRGMDAFIEEECDFFTGGDFVSIVNIAGSTEDEYLRMAEKLNKTKVNILEINLSCPNVDEGCMLFGSNPALVEAVVRRLKGVTSKPLWIKLTPNTASIVETALAAEKAGADGISLINTLLGLSVDVKTRRPVITNNYAGLSGPAIKPVALRMVNEVYRAVKIPVIGMGGVMNATDLLEFMLAGASLVQVGTANIVDPYACPRILDELNSLMEEMQIDNLSEIVGKLKLWGED